MEALGINLPGLIAQLVNFLLLFFILSKFLFPRVIGMLDARAERIRESIERAEQIQRDAERMEQQFQERLAEGRREAQQIISNATGIAQRIQAEALEKATRDQEALLVRAREQIARETEQARIQLRAETANLVSLVAGKVIAQSLNGQQHLDLIDRVLNETEGTAAH